ncbi:MAG: adenylate/guanylate cyclase domain-containing protein [Candidatus Rokuibacteriota bacterium]
MQCPRCQAQNRPSAQFCRQCGARLEAVCPKCNAQVEPGSRFCDACGADLAADAVAPAATAPAPPAQFGSPGAYTPKHLAEKILTSRSALEGERKQVTVLFVDVSGFTSLSERLDPEDVHRLMTRAFELMLEEVHRYEGTVNQFLGDGIMALFGAPIAHEDHAQRAVHAALGIRKALEGHQEELQRKRGITFTVRQGLNTGLVVVGSIGSDLRMDYTAVGDTTNIAARLQQAADPGRILVSDATHRLVEGYFYTRPLGDLTLKGRAEPVRAWEVIAARQARGRLEVEAERGLTPYVGRERELRLLFECFEKVKAGHGQVVFIVGEPGIGKSRLLYEFRRRLGDLATWNEGRCMSFGRSIALHPTVDMMKRTFRIEEGDTEGTIAKKVERGVVLLGEDLRPIVPYLRYVLSVDPGDPAVPTMDPQQRRGEIFDALRRLLLRASEVRPQVLVHEDVHWIDKATEESLLFTADSIPTRRILHILTYRPGYTHPFGERTYHTRIAIDTLSSEDSVQMAQVLLSAENLPEELKNLIVRKAEGNPFFVEEVVKSLQEVGAIRREGSRYVLTKRLDEIVIPDTIQDVIMARIDRLADAPKKTLQLASVIGREFTRRLLDRIADLRGRTEDFLRELKAIELIYEKSLFPELAYMFKHALTHDVAYNSMLVQRRKELHQVIALAIEELYGDRLTEHYEMLAYHFSKAEDWARALEYLLKAADKGSKTFANREAISLYDQALEAASHLGEAVGLDTLMAIHEAKSGLYFMLSDFANSRAEAERLLGLARRAGDRVKEGAALAGMGFASLWAHDFEHALAESREAIAAAAPLDAKPVLAAGHFTTGFVLAVTEQLEDAQREFDQALTLSRAADDKVHEAFSLGFSALLRNWEGHYDDAKRVAIEGLKTARESGVVIPVYWLLFIHTVVLVGKGDYDEALAIGEEGLAFCEKIGDEVMYHRILNTLGWLWSELGDLERAIEYSRRCAEGARKRGDPETAGNAETNLGDIFIVKGDLTLAGEVLDGVYRMVKDPATSDWMKWRYSTHLFGSMADLWLTRGDYAKATRWADQCLEIATRTRARKNLVKGWRAKGEIATRQRRWDEAEQALREALTIAQAIGNPGQLWRTHAALGRLRAAAGKAEDARAAHGASLDIIDGMRTRLQNPGLKASLERAAFVQRIVELNAPR